MIKNLFICRPNVMGCDRDIKENRTKIFRRHPAWHIIDDDVGFEKSAMVTRSPLTICFHQD